MQTNPHLSSIRFKAGALASALSRIAPIASDTKATTAGHALVEISRGQVAITAANHAMTLRTALACEGGPETTSFSVHARKLLDFAKSYDGQADMDVNPEDGGLRCRTGRTRFRLQRLGTDQLPIQQDFKPQITLTMPAKDYQVGISVVRLPMPKDDPRTILNGTLLRVEKGRARLVATDGHRLHEVFLGAPVDPKLELALCIPRAAALQIEDLCKAGGDLRIEIDGQRIRCTAGADQLTCKALQGQFPPYDRLIPGSPAPEIVMSRHALLQALSSIRAATDKAGPRIVVSASREGLTIEAQADNDDASVTIDAQYSGDPWTAAFSQVYLSDAASSFDTEDVRLQVYGPMDAVVMRPVGDKPGLALVMPQR